MKREWLDLWNFFFSKGTINTEKEIFLISCLITLE